MRMLRALCVVAIALGAGAFETFEGHQVIQIDTPTQSEVDWVARFMEEHPDVDMWLEPSVGGAAHLMLSKEQLTTLELPSYSVFVDDVTSLIAQSFKRSESQSWHEEYHPLGEINQFITDKANEYANVEGINAELFEVGQSWENRTILGLKFGGSSSANPVRIVWNGVQHAREWIGPATLMYIMDRLFDGWQTDARITEVLSKTEFHIVPVTNPDGYDFTWTNNRLWRKTRSTYNAPRATGTDPNRNWDYQWGGAGASTSPFSETYRGPFAHSEPEVEQFTAYIGTLDNVGGYIDWHSYGNYILSAWGYTSDRSPDYDDQVGLAARMNNAIRAVNGRTYTYGPSGQTLYPTSGSAPDYTYGFNGVKYSYTIELPGSPGGFILPPEYIIGVGQESLQGGLVFVEQAIAEGPEPYLVEQ